jgi:hypothetical protein
MEKSELRINNILINSLIVFYWLFVFFGSLYWIFSSGLFNTYISLIASTLLFFLLGWPIRMYWINIYHDVLVFKEQGFHPTIKSDFGVAFCNIYEYRIKKIVLNQYWVVLKRENGKTIRRIFPMSKSDLNFLSNKIADEINKKNKNASA